jgi:hypothetical protein
MVSYILNLDTRQRRMVSFTPQLCPLVPTEQSGRIPEPGSGQGGEETNLCPCLESNPNSPIQPVI